jgi:hypothetical protein
MVWRCGFASVKPSVQTPVTQKKNFEKRKDSSRNLTLIFLLIGSSLYQKAMVSFSLRLPLFNKN